MGHIAQFRVLNPLNIYFYSVNKVQADLFEVVTQSKSK